MTKTPLSRQPRPILISNREPVPRLRFKELRMNVAGTRRKMASDLGVTEITIQKLEQGRGTPSFPMSFVYADYLGSSIDEIFPDIVSEARSYLASRNFG